MKVAVGMTARRRASRLALWLALLGAQALSGEAPPLHVDPDCPHYFGQSDGKPVVLIGDDTWGTSSDQSRAVHSRRAGSTRAAGHSASPSAWLVAGRKNSRHRMNKIGDCCSSVSRKRLRTLT